MLPPGVFGIHGLDFCFPCWSFRTSGLHRNMMAYDGILFEDISSEAWADGAKEFHQESGASLQQRAP